MIGFKATDKGNRKTEIGYWLSQDYQGKGIMTCAVESLCRYAFEELGMNRVQIKCAVGNTLSSNIPKRLGFKFEGVERAGELFADGNFVDIEVYSLLKMNVTQLTENKKQYLDLLLLADGQESMIDRYLERGEMFMLGEGDVKAVCVVTDEGNGVCELKNIAVKINFQRKGYGKKLIEYLIAHYTGKYRQMIVGTGDVPSAISFYTNCGFGYSHRVENFFTDNYDHQIVEDSVLLTRALYIGIFRPHRLCSYA